MNGIHYSSDHSYATFKRIICCMVLSFYVYIIIHNVRVLICYFCSSGMAFSVTIVSKSFFKIVDQTEKHYGTLYKIEKIPDELIKVGIVDYFGIM